jgi:predicted ester cyclase
MPASSQSHQNSLNNLVHADDDFPNFAFNSPQQVSTPRSQLLAVLHFSCPPESREIFAKAILPSDKQRRNSSQTTAKEKFAD